jgi:protein TonB
MPNEGHLGGFDIRRFVQRYMTIGLIISILVHAFVIGSYKFIVYLLSREPAPTRVIYLDASNLGPPPTLSGEETAPSLKIAQPKLAPPAAAIPKPVAEDVAPEEPQIQTQQQLSEILDTKVDSLALGDLGENIEIRQDMLDEENAKNPVFIPYEEEPHIVKEIKPVYPEMAALAGINGKVIVQFYVDKKGNVKNPRAIKAEPKGMGFEEAAVEAVLQWKFTPALQQNNPVGVWVAQTVTFKIK